MAAAGETAIVGESLSETHTDSSANGSGKANQKSVPTISRGNRGSKDGCERGDGAIHQSRQAGLNNLEQEKPALSLLFSYQLTASKFFLLKLLRAVVVRAFLLGKVVEKLADASVLRASGGVLVEALCLDLSRADLLADAIHIEWLEEPDWFATDEAAHVGASDERYVFPEFLPEKLDQTAAMPRFLLAHPVENRRGAREILTKAFGVVGVHAFVFLLKRNRQGQNFAFR